MFGWKTAVVLGASSYMLPDPASTVAFATALGLGCGAGIGAGYAAYLRAVTPARKQAILELDEATKGTTKAELAEAQRQIEENRVLIERMVREHQERASVLEKDLEATRAHAARLSNDLEDFARILLQGKGLLVVEPHDVGRGDSDPATRPPGDRPSPS